MRKWIACLLVIAVAFNLTACNPSDVSSDEIRDAANLLQELADEMDLAGIASIDLTEMASDTEGAEDVPEAANDEEADVASSEAAEVTSEEEVPQNREVVEDGFDTFLTSEPCSAGDDFYSYVNYDKIRYEKVPAGNSNWSIIRKLGFDTDEQVKSIIMDATYNYDGSDKNSPEYRLGAFYETLSDFDARNEAGLEPVMKYIKAFDDAKNLDELVDADIEYFKETGNNALFYVDYMCDLQDSNQYALVFDFCSNGEPGKEVITDPEMDYCKDAYLTYLGEILRHAGYDKLEAAMKGASAFGLLKEWEAHSLTADERYNPSLYVDYSSDELISKFDKLPVKKYLDAFEIDDLGVDKFTLNQNEAMAGLNDIFDEDHLEMFRNIMITRVLSDNDMVLDEYMYNAARKYNMATRGLTEDKDLETILTSYTSDILSADIGRIYAKEFCSPEIKEDVTGIIYEILEAYHEQINECEWMSEPTKKKAIEKLDKMHVFAAYPDKYYDPAEYAVLTAKSDGGTLFDNWSEINKSYFRFFLETVPKKVDKDICISYPQVVNAFYDPSANSITINAAILQKGIYDINADAGSNLGGVGVVIGHEISHAFDVNGSEYDADGNLNNWWTDEDYDKYQLICDKVVDVYSNFEIIPGSGICPSGKMTLGENMADISGMQVIEKICNNDADMFGKACMAEAELWGTKMLHDTTTYYLKVDTHSPAKARVNIPIQMCDLFYDAFDVKQGDSMYVDKENRIRIW